MQELCVLLIVCAPRVLSADVASHQAMVEQYWLRDLIRFEGTMRPEQDAAGAVDGIRHEKDKGMKVPWAEARSDKWWSVDLEAPATLGKVVIYAWHAVPNQLERIQVQTSLDAKAWKTVYTHDGTPFNGGKPGTEPLTVNLKGERTRYIRLFNKRREFGLNEVEVYASGDDETNVALRKSATQCEVDDMGSTLSKPDYTVFGSQRINNCKFTPAGIVSNAFELADRTVDYVGKTANIPLEYRTELADLRRRWDSKSVPESDYPDLYVAIRRIRRKVLFLHPALDFEKILINRNPPTLYNHNADQYMGRYSRAGPGLTILTEWKTAPKAEVILEGKLPVGATRNPALNYDADRVVFAFCNHEEPFGTQERTLKITQGQSAPEGRLERRFLLYEASVDGSWVRQLTGTKEDPFRTRNNLATAIIEDSDPAYLPGGAIVFVSSRVQSFNRCSGLRYTPAFGLYRADKDGGNIRPLSWNNENDYEPSVLNDGRIVFCRWEYTSRNEIAFHMLWSTRADGSGVANFFGADMMTPYMISEARSIPASRKVVATVTGHHMMTQGSIVIIDPNKGENGEQSLTHLTPETVYPESNGYSRQNFCHPYALNEELFLVSRVHGPPRPHPIGNAIYLIDAFGGRELVFDDPKVSSFSPIPVIERKRPPALASTLAPGQTNATLFVQDVYRTRNDPKGKIKRGDIKAIRVVALGVKARNDGFFINPMVHVEIPRKIIGTAAVGPDGSAHFEVPAETPIYLQTLYKDGRAMLSENTFFYLQRGETRSCVGCHEPSGTAPGSLPARRPKLQKLRPAAGPQYPGGISFMRTVQPVLDRHCIRCHGLGKTNKGVNLVSDTHLTVGFDEYAARVDFSKSYHALHGRGKHWLGQLGHMREEYGNIGRPYEFFAHANKVSDMILEGHGNVRMGAEDRMRLIEWMDVNAPAYGDVFPNWPELRRIDPEAMKELRTYIRTRFKTAEGRALGNDPDGALINLAQPEESRVLMAPLAESAGGWGQIDEWQTRESAGYKAVNERVQKCILVSPNENRNGWRPKLECGGAVPWVRTDRERYQKFIASIFTLVK